MKKVYISYILIILLISFGLILDFDYTQRFMITFGFFYAIFDCLLRINGIRK